MTKPLEKYGYGVVGPGWKHLLETLDSHFETAVENAVANATLAKPEYKREGNTPQARIEVLQVKEKFGGLRVYFRTHGMEDRLSENLFGAVSFAESLSCSTCEKCGSREGAKGRRKKEETLGLILTLCTKCNNEREALPKDTWFDLGYEE